MITHLLQRRAAPTIHISSKRQMASVARQQPPWHPPQPSNGPNGLPPLKIFNSLTRSKNDFIPIESSGKKVTWYCCGPTVYDAGHLGHARNYVSTDILRRILQDYFGFNVRFVMNITDVDDKIILRARQQHLLRTFRTANFSSPEKVAETAKSAFQAYLAKNLPRLPSNIEPSRYEEESEKAYGDVKRGGTMTGQGMPGDTEAKVKMHLSTAEAAARVLTKDNPPLDVLYNGASDILLPYLDSLHGDSIKSTDYGIFTKLTQYWEQHFKDDLRTLNCLPPTLLTRVTEFIRENVEFVEKIVKKGFAYVTADGSVYFDINAFEKAGNSYARLQPWNRNDQDLQADGEGSLSKKTAEKRSAGDFALWKSSKPGEPSWDSPWGPGRPGWHIECSVMCSDVLGSQIDIHSGGIDLAFPHHDNELAQSEAFWVDGSEKPHQWINYFLHMGHLSIQGSKMSKSLKNFTTIRAALDKDGGWTARGLRIVFLQGAWKEGIEVTDDIVKAGNAWENLVDRFFDNAKALMLDNEVTQELPELHVRPEEQKLLSSLDQCQLSVHEALCDSFNTPNAMQAIQTLIVEATAYMSPRLTRKAGAYLNIEVVKEVSRWVTRMVRIFGLDSTGESTGWTGGPSQGDDAQKIALPYARALVDFRDQIRKLATSQDSPIKKELLAICDRVRDVELVNLGVDIDDSDKADPNEPITIRFVDKAKLLQTQKDKTAAQANKEEVKEAQRLQREVQAKALAERSQIDEREMFRTAEYSAWDKQGLPTHDREGKELTKSRQKKLCKEWEAQKKRRARFIDSSSSGGPT
ncbi:MAG: hypothetical protein M1814_004215 [Vezdaea aestivalis]|nr:MAG: hypothetical protein M1814_004215 [Vezdaea aestivalis]